MLVELFDEEYESVAILNVSDAVTECGIILWGNKYYMFHGGTPLRATELPRFIVAAVYNANTVSTEIVSL